MEKIKRIIASLVLGILSLPYALFAQDEGTYIENLGVQDSTYMQDDLLSGSSESAGSGTTVAIIIAAVVVIAGVVFFILKEKEKIIVFSFN